MASQSLRTLKLSLLADVSEFGKGMGTATSDFQKFSRGLETAAGVATGVIGAIGAVGISAIQAASDLAETSAAIEQIFGRRSAAQLQAFASNAAQSLGQSRQQALEAAQSFGIFGKAAGLSGTELVTFTTDLVTLATDLAAFNNTTVDEAITALGAALRGESEPIRNYGVLLNAAAIENRALAEGLIESGDGLDQQTRILATFLEVFGQTGVQQGTFARESEGLAASQKTLTARIQDFRTELGEELFPLVEELLPRVKGFFDTILEAEPEDIIEVSKAIGILAGAIVALNTSLKVFAGLQAAYRFLTSPLGAIVGAGAVTVATGQNLPPGFVGGGAAVPDLGLRSESTFQRERFAETAGRRRTGNVQVNLNGVVGSTYQVQREIERQLEALQRNRLGSAGTFR